MLLNVEVKESSSLHSQHLPDAWGIFLPIQRTDIDHVVSWSEDGRGFIIKQIDLFSQNILPQYFKHKNYSSFVRQVSLQLFSWICMGSTSRDSRSTIISLYMSSSGKESWRMEGVRLKLRSEGSLRRKKRWVRREGRMVRARWGKVRTVRNLSWITNQLVSWCTTPRRIR